MYPKLAHGVTLLEMLIVLSITIIMAVVAIPSFISFLNNYRMQGIAENLYHVVQFARSESIKRNANIYISFRTGNNWCYGVNLSSACTCTTPSSCSLGVTSAGSSTALSLTATGLTNNAVYFEGSRGASSGSAQLTFTQTNGTQSISTKISSLGNIKICSDTEAGYMACT